MQVAEKIWQEIQNTKEPVDLWLRRFFQRNRKKYGARDRRSLTDEIYARLRKEPFPEWLVKRWASFYGKEETERILESLGERAPFTVRCNPLKISRDELIRCLQPHGISMKPAGGTPYGIHLERHKHLLDCNEYREGLFEVQDAGSQIVCQWVDPKPGDDLWDVCAGAGGKTLLLAAMMGNKGRITATDTRETILKNLKKRARRAGVLNVRVKPTGSGGLKLSHAFDKILVDAPCTGTGTIRRRPELKGRIRETDFDAFHAKQVGILQMCLPALKPKGTLIYATCSIDRRENEEVIERILKNQDHLVLERSGHLWPHKEGSDAYFIAVLGFKKSKV